MPLGEDGLGLSGGQKQIVSLARLTLRLLEWYYLMSLQRD